MPAIKCVLSAPGGPKASRLWPCAIQLSASASAMTWALETVGTAAKSNSLRLLPGGSWLSVRARASRRVSRSAISCSSSAPRKRCAGHNFANWRIYLQDDTAEDAQICAPSQAATPAAHHGTNSQAGDEPPRLTNSAHGRIYGGAEVQFCISRELRRASLAPLAGVVFYS